MKILTIILLLVFTSKITYSQNNLNIERNWEIGSTYQFKVHKITNEIKNDSVIKNDTSLYVAIWEILSKNEKGFTLKWKFSNSFLGEHNSIRNSNRFKEEDLSVLYSVMPNGKFKEILNWSEIKKKILETLKNLKNEESISMKSYKFLKSWYSDEITLNSLVGREIALIHQAFELNYSSLNDTIIESGESYNIFSKTPITITIKQYFEHSTESEFCIIKSEKYDKEASKKLVLDVVKKYPSNHKDSTDINLLNIDLQKNYRVVYDSYSYTPIFAEFETLNIVNLGFENKIKSKKIILTFEK